MNVTRARAGSALLLAAFLSLGLTLRLAIAQPAGKSPPSPVEPGDLTKPVFDTKTPLYDAAPAFDKAANTVVAEVEGRPITMGDVGDAIRALPPNLAKLSFETLYPGILRQLINQQALVVRASQQGVDEEPAVRRRVKAAADRQLSEEYMQRELSKGITETALLERYNRDISGRPGEEEASVRVILTDTEKAAADVIAELRGGADFTTVARRVSKDPTAPAGGDLGYVTRGGLNPQVGAVAFALPPGQVAPYPVRVEARWFVVKVDDRRRRPTPGFASVREQLRQSMIREGVVAFAAAALKDLKVREFDFLGHEIDATLAASP
jgi:peptidyl-prolyl cis-trans isomerase C